MEPGRAKFVSNVLFGAGILVMLLGRGFENILTAVLGLLIIVAGAAVQLIFWRCPSCGRYLGRSTFGDIEYCPHCGAPL